MIHGSRRNKVGLKQFCAVVVVPAIGDGNRGCVMNHKMEQGVRALSKPLPR